jgi:non-homologous end joining protein Ku
MVWHDKETLVLIRPYEGGLVLQIMYYGNEIRDFDQIAKGENLRLTSDGARPRADRQTVV